MHYISTRCGFFIRNKMTEVWKDIKGYEGLYQISNLGRVKSLAHLHGKSKKLIRKEKIMQCVIGIKGYLYCGLSKNGLTKRYRVHRLVAEAFIGNPNELPQVNHIDGDKANNRADNLEYCTCAYNVRHAFLNGLRKGIRDSDNALSKKVNQYALSGDYIKTWDSTMQIERNLGITNVSISQCCLGKIKSSHGYIWRYAE